MMTEHNDPPPPYSGLPSTAATPTAPPYAVVEETATTDTSQQARNSRDRSTRNHGQHSSRHTRHPVDSEARHLIEREPDRHRQHSPRRTDHSEGRQACGVGTINASHSFSGFIDMLYEKKKLPWSFSKNIIYKLGLTIFYLVHLIHSIVSFAIQGGDHIAFHLVYILISFVGFAFMLIIMIVTILTCRIPSNSSSGDDVNETLINENDTAERLPDGNNVTSLPNIRDTRRAHEQVQNYYHKGNRVLADYALSSLGEFLIYPTLICVLYGFINERGWRFDNGISISYTVLLVYSVLMDALYMKLYVIFLLIRVLRATYKKYDELVQPTEIEWKRYFTPVYLSIPFAIIIAPTHWFMTGIIASRIYVDNFSGKIDDTNSSVPDTGDYRVAPLTEFMIACTIYLPIVSWITYIIINKPWFYEVYSAIHQLGNGADHLQEGIKWDKKLLAFIKDPLAYIAIMFLIPPFIAFTVATYLPDYDSSELELTSTARDVLQALESWFIILFLISNVQAAITFTVVVIIVIVTLGLCGLPECGVVYYKYCKQTKVFR